MEVAEEIYRITSSFPKHEIYGLTSQIRRAAVSVLSNIAEGSSRESTKEYLHHVSIAVGSLAELESQLLLAARLELANPGEIEAVLGRGASVGKMLRGLQRSLRAKLTNESPRSVMRNPSH